MPPVPDPGTVRDFLASTISVLRETTGTSAAVASPGTRRTNEDAIAIIVHARGQLSGLTWSFPFELLRDAARHMVEGIEPDREVCEATASELANILTGRGAASLESHGVVLEIEPPEVGALACPGIIAFLTTPNGVIEIIFHGGQAFDEQ